MGKKSKGKDRVGIVYSTNSDHDYSYDDGEEQDTLPPEEQRLRVHLDTKQRKGKAVTLVEEFVGTSDDLSDLGKFLKTKLGVGGSAKDGIIIVQGDHRKKVGDLLTDKGYRVKVY